MRRLPRIRYERLVELCALLITGTLLVIGRGEHPEDWFLPFALTAVTAAALGIVFFLSAFPHGKKTALLLFFTAFLGSSGVVVLRNSVSSSQFFGLEPERVKEITGTVLDDRRTVSSGGARTTLRLVGVSDEYGNRAAALGRVTVFCRRTFSPDKGSLIRVRAELFPVDGKAGGDTTGKAGRALYLAAAEAAPEILRDPPGHRAFRSDLISYFLGRIRSTGRDSSALLQALILGYSGSRSEGLYDLFRKSGNAHLLALSGMHLGILSLGVLWLFLPILGRKRAVFVSLLVIAGYLLLVGPRPSLVRAVMMYAVGSGAFLLFGVKPDLFHILVVTFVIQVFLSPDSASSLGFQLSYLALAGIILWSGLVEGWLPFWIPRGVRQVLAAGIAAQLSTAFLLVRTFGVLYPFGTFSVLLLSPLIVVWMWTGILYVLWSLCAELISGPMVVRIDLVLRGVIELAAEETVRIVELGAALPAVIISPGYWGWTALAGGLLLTLLTVSRYAGSHAADRKLQLSRGNQPLSCSPWGGRKPPLWTELSDIQGGAGENNRAA